MALATRYVLLGLAVVVINFALPRALPGDPLVNPDQPGVSLSGNQLAQLRAMYRLDQPIGGQFGGYLWDLSHADLGWSISRNAPVGQLIGERLPWTLALVGISVLIAAVGGASLGMLAAWHGGRFDRLVLGASSSLAALPEFLVAMLLLVVLAVGLGWLPLTGGQAPFAQDQSWTAALGDRASHLILPAATLVVANLAAFALLSRGAVRGELGAPYLATARAKGLDDRRMAVVHAAPNAVLPVLTMFGMRLGQVLGGAIVVERVFGVPGLGLFAVQAIQSRDYPVLQAIFLLASLGVLAANFALELAYRRFQPRRAAW
jgi:peptide/nickel transport system permease protein